MRVKKLAIGLLATSLCIGCMGMSYGTLGDELVYGEMNGDLLETFASNLSVLNDEFCDWDNAQIVLEDEEYAYTAEGNNCSLYYVVHDNETLGYMVTTSNGDVIAYGVGEEVDPLISEYALEYSESEDEVRNAEGEISVTATNSSVVLSGLNPQLQGSYNCIVAAASNVMWYYGENGYSALIGSDTFDTVKNRMNYFYINNGGYTNNGSPAAISGYVNAKTSGALKATVYVTWDPSQNQMLYEISSGRPFMLGYAAGSIFSADVGHMTMCCGYMTLNSELYAYVITGHSTGPTYIKWDDDINDCIITIKIS